MTTYDVELRKQGTLEATIRLQALSAQQAITEALSKVGAKPIKVVLDDSIYHGYTGYDALARQVAQ